VAIDELLSDEDAVRSAHRPQYCHWAAAQVLRACGEAARSKELLKRAHDALEHSAGAILEPGTRSAYLRQSFNQEIVAAHARDIWPGVEANI
jgi:hypothetical protein